MEISIIILAVFQLATLALVLLQFNPKSTNTKSTKKIVLDTSAVIDGRILALAEAGFMNGNELISTNRILDELQYLADEGDSFKRSRARYGLEVLNKLRSLSQISMVTTNLPKSELETDQQLLNHAKSIGAQLFTADFNLAQRARVEGVDILSPNDLSEALKPEILPGETFKIKLIQKGDDRGQAVGYLPDGTMVVAENSQNKIGQTLEFKSSKIIQTTAGRIVFAQQVGARSGSQRSKSQAPKAKQDPVSKPEVPIDTSQGIKPAPKPRVARVVPPKTPNQNQQSSQSRPQRQQNNQANNQPRKSFVAQKEDALIDAINNSK